MTRPSLLVATGTGSKRLPLKSPRRTTFEEVETIEEAIESSVVSADLRVTSTEELVREARTHAVTQH